MALALPKTRFCCFGTSWGTYQPKWHTILHSGSAVPLTNRELCGRIYLMWNITRMMYSCAKWNFCFSRRNARDPLSHFPFYDILMVGSCVFTCALRLTRRTRPQATHFRMLWYNGVCMEMCLAFSYTAATSFCHERVATEPPDSLFA